VGSVVGRLDVGSVVGLVGSMVGSNEGSMVGKEDGSLVGSVVGVVSWKVVAPTDGIIRFILIIVTATNQKSKIVLDIDNITEVDYF